MSTWKCFGLKNFIQLARNYSLFIAKYILSKKLNNLKFLNICLVLKKFYIFLCRIIIVY